MHLSVVTPEGSFYEGEVDSVQLPAFDGFLGILESHAPLLTELGAGELRASSQQGEVTLILSGGYLQVLNNTVTVLATRAYKSGDVDFDKVQKELDKAQSLESHDDDSFDEREKAISRAKALLALK